MINTHSSISFYCRQSRVDKHGTSPIEVSVTLGGVRMLSTLPRRCKPNEFKKLMGARSQNPIKEYTSTVSSKIEDLILRCMLDGILFTKDILRTNIQYGFCEQRECMGSLFSSFLSSQMKKVKAGLSTYKNYRKYEIVKGLFFSYSNINEETLVISIRQRDIVDFNTFLLSKYDETTVAGMMQKLKSVFLFALRNRIITDNPFLGYSITRKEKEVEFLNEEEVTRIRTTPLPSESLDRIRDLFLFQCYTSLSYCDMAALTPDDFKKNDYEQIYIEKKRKKTGVGFLVILFEDAITIAKKYNYKLPIVSNQRYNGYLKLIADYCSISKPLHTHIGRHTAACYLLNKGLPLEVVARIMGHATTKITKHYAKLLDDTVFKSVERVMGGK